MVVSSEAAAAWWWIYIAFCHHYESCPYCFFPGWPIFLSFLGRLGSNIKSNQIKNDYIVILLFLFASVQTKRARAQTRVIYRPLPSSALCPPPPSHTWRACCVFYCPLNTIPWLQLLQMLQRFLLTVNANLAIATAKGRYDWDVPTAQIRPLVKMQHLYKDHIALEVKPLRLKFSS